MLWLSRLRYGDNEYIIRVLACAQNDLHIDIKYEGAKNRCNSSVTISLNHSTHVTGAASGNGRSFVSWLCRIAPSRVYLDQILSFSLSLCRGGFSCFFSLIIFSNSLSYFPSVPFLLMYLLLFDFICAPSDFAGIHRSLALPARLYYTANQRPRCSRLVARERDWCVRRWNADSPEEKRCRSA